MSYEDQSSFTLAADPDPQIRSASTRRPGSAAASIRSERRDRIAQTSCTAAIKDALRPPVPSRQAVRPARTASGPCRARISSRLEASTSIPTISRSTAKPGRPRALHLQPGTRRSGRASRRDESHLTGSTRPARAVSEDGILIDFDDDDE
jgi:hypothetical protein